MQVYSYMPQCPIPQQDVQESGFDLQLHINAQIYTNTYKILIIKHCTDFIFGVKHIHYFYNAGKYKINSLYKLYTRMSSE